MLIGNTTITPMSKQDQLTLSCDSDNLSERDEAEADVSIKFIVVIYYEPLWVPFAIAIVEG